MVSSEAGTHPGTTMAIAQLPADRMESSSRPGTAIPRPLSTAGLTVQESQKDGRTASLLDVSVRNIANVAHFLLPLTFRKIK